MSSVSDSHNLKNIIVDRINNSPRHQITFADYMNLVLYHPQYGYYASGTVGIGSLGDFFTSSSLGSDFGELLAEQFVDFWKKLGTPAPFMLIEVGAGSGLLASDILSYLRSSYPDFFSIVDYTIVEESQALIARQKEALKLFLDNKTKIEWKTWQDIPQESIIGCIFSNELVDAFPVHQIAIAQGQLKEIYVTHIEGKLTEAIDKISTPKLEEYFQLVEIDLPSDAYPEGYRSEVNLTALSWLETIANKLKRGYLLTIDYGYSAQKYYHPQRDRGTLQCYYQHRRHNNPYINIGTQDITAHVDFTALERQGELWGLAKIGFIQQAMFLMALGLGDRLSALSSGQFNFQQILQRRDALHQLIEPTGLGGFGVLIQSKGLFEEEKTKQLKGLKVF
jgi:SAM-dependent MidA family methyltransferase